MVIPTPESGVINTGAKLQKQQALQVGREWAKKDVEKAKREALSHTSFGILNVKRRGLHILEIGRNTTQESTAHKYRDLLMDVCDKTGIVLTSEFTPEAAQAIKNAQNRAAIDSELTAMPVAGGGTLKDKFDNLVSQHALQRDKAKLRLEDLATARSDREQKQQGVLVLNKPSAILTTPENKLAQAISNALDAIETSGSAVDSGKTLDILTKQIHNVSIKRKGLFNRQVADTSAIDSLLNARGITREALAEALWAKDTEYRRVKATVQPGLANIKAYMDAQPAWIIANAAENSQVHYPNDGKISHFFYDTPGLRLVADLAGTFSRNSRPLVGAASAIAIGQSLAVTSPVGVLVLTGAATARGIHAAHKERIVQQKSQSEYLQGHRATETSQHIREQTLADRRTRARTAWGRSQRSLHLITRLNARSSEVYKIAKTQERIDRISRKTQLDANIGVRYLVNAQDIISNIDNAWANSNILEARKQVAELTARLKFFNATDGKGEQTFTQMPNKNLQETITGLEDKRQAMYTLLNLEHNPDFHTEVEKMEKSIAKAIKKMRNSNRIYQALAGTKTGVLTMVTAGVGFEAIHGLLPAIVDNLHMPDLPHFGGSAAVVSTGAEHTATPAPTDVINELLRNHNPQYAVETHHPAFIGLKDVYNHGHDYKIPANTELDFNNPNGGVLWMDDNGREIILADHIHVISNGHVSWTTYDHLGTDNVHQEIPNVAYTHEGTFQPGQSINTEQTFSNPNFSQEINVGYHDSVGSYHIDNQIGRDGHGLYFEPDDTVTDPSAATVRDSILDAVQQGHGVDLIVNDPSNSGHGIIVHLSAQQAREMASDHFRIYLDASQKFPVGDGTHTISGAELANSMGVNEGRISEYYGGHIPNGNFSIDNTEWNQNHSLVNVNYQVGVPDASGQDQVLVTIHGEASGFNPNIDIAQSDSSFNFTQHFSPDGMPMHNDITAITIPGGKSFAFEPYINMEYLPGHPSDISVLADIGGKPLYGFAVDGHMAIIYNGNLYANGYLVEPGDGGIFSAANFDHYFGVAPGHDLPDLLQGVGVTTGSSGGPFDFVQGAINAFDAQPLWAKAVEVGVPAAAVATFAGARIAPEIAERLRGRVPLDNVARALNIPPMQPGENRVDAQNRMQRQIEFALSSTANPQAITDLVNSIRRKWGATPSAYNVLAEINSRFSLVTATNTTQAIRQALLRGGLAGLGSTPAEELTNVQNLLKTQLGVDITGLITLDSLITKLANTIVSNGGTDRDIVLTSLQSLSNPAGLNGTYTSEQVGDKLDPLYNVLNPGEALVRGKVITHLAAIYPHLTTFGFVPPITTQAQLETLLSGIGSNRDLRDKFKSIIQDPALTDKPLEIAKYIDEKSPVSSGLQAVQRGLHGMTLADVAEKIGLPRPANEAAAANDLATRFDKLKWRSAPGAPLQQVTAQNIFDALRDRRTHGTLNNPDDAVDTIVHVHALIAPLTAREFKVVVDSAIPGNVVMQVARGVLGVADESAVLSYLETKFGFYTENDRMDKFEVLAEKLVTAAKPGGTLLTSTALESAIRGILMASPEFAATNMENVLERVLSSGYAWQPVLERLGFNTTLYTGNPLQILARRLEVANATLAHGGGTLNTPINLKDIEIQLRTLGSSPSPESVAGILEAWYEATDPGEIFQRAHMSDTLEQAVLPVARIWLNKPLANKPELLVLLNANALISSNLPQFQTDLQAALGRATDPDKANEIVRLIDNRMVLGPTEYIDALQRGALASNDLSAVARDLSLEPNTEAELLSRLTRSGKSPDDILIALRAIGGGNPLSADTVALELKNLLTPENGGEVFQWAGVSDAIVTALLPEAKKWLNKSVVNRKEVLDLLNTTSDITSDVVAFQREVKDALRQVTDPEKGLAIIKAIDKRMKPGQTEFADAIQRGALTAVDLNDVARVLSLPSESELIARLITENTKNHLTAEQIVLSLRTRGAGNPLSADAVAQELRLKLQAENFDEALKWIGLSSWSSQELLALTKRLEFVTPPRIGRELVILKDRLAETDNAQTNKPVTSQDLMQAFQLLPKPVPYSELEKVVEALEDLYKPKNGAEVVRRLQRRMPPNSDEEKHFLEGMNQFLFGKTGQADWSAVSLEFNRRNSRDLHPSDENAQKKEMGILYENIVRAYDIPNTALEAGQDAALAADAIFSATTMEDAVTRSLFQIASSGELKNLLNRLGWDENYTLAQVTTRLTGAEWSTPPKHPSPQDVLSYFRSKKSGKLPETLDVTAAFSVLENVYPNSAEILAKLISINSNIKTPLIDALAKRLGESTIDIPEISRRIDAIPGITPKKISKLYTELQTIVNGGGTDREKGIAIADKIDSEIPVTGYENVVSRGFYDIDLEGLNSLLGLAPVTGTSLEKTQAATTQIAGWLSSHVDKTGTLLTDKQIFGNIRSQQRTLLRQMNEQEVVDYFESIYAPLDGMDILYRMRFDKIAPSLDTQVLAKVSKILGKSSLSIGQLGTELDTLTLSPQDKENFVIKLNEIIGNNIGGKSPTEVSWTAQKLAEYLDDQFIVSDLTDALRRGLALDSSEYPNVLTQMKWQDTAGNPLQSLVDRLRTAKWNDGSGNPVSQSEKEIFKRFRDKMKTLSTGNYFGLKEAIEVLNDVLPENGHEMLNRLDILSTGKETELIVQLQSLISDATLDITGVEQIIATKCPDMQKLTQFYLQLQAEINFGKQASKNDHDLMTPIAEKISTLDNRAKQIVNAVAGTSGNYNLQQVIQDLTTN